MKVNYHFAKNNEEFRSPIRHRMSRKKRVTQRDVLNIIYQLNEKYGFQHHGVNVNNDYYDFKIINNNNKDFYMLRYHNPEGLRHALTDAMPIREFYALLQGLAVKVNFGRINRLEQKEKKPNKVILTGKMVEIDISKEK